MLITGYLRVGLNLIQSHVARINTTHFFARNRAKLQDNWIKLGKSCFSHFNQSHVRLVGLRQILLHLPK